MEINETTVLDDRGFVKINGDEAKSFLQNIVTNDIEKITDSLTLFSSIFTPQGKYLYEFFILKFEDGYLLECEKKLTSEIIKIFDFYKLRAKVNLIDVSKKYTNIIISLEKFKEITKTEHVKGSTLSCEEGSTLSCENERIYVDSRHKNLGAKIITKIENAENIIKKLDLKKIDKNIFTKSGLMVGLGENKDEILQVMDDLRSAEVDFLTIGQYLQPSVKHHPLYRYYKPEEFEEFKTIAKSKGFLLVSSSPLTRSSYHADKDFAILQKNRINQTNAQSIS